MEPKDTLSSCSDSDEQDIQRMLKRANILKDSCLNDLSALKLNFTRKQEYGITKSEFERAFSHIFGEDVNTFTRTFSQNMDTLEQQLTKETILDLDGTYARKDFHAYTGMEPQLFKETILKNFDFIKNYMLKIIIHAQTIQKRLDDKKLQIQECTVQKVKASDVILEDKAQEHCMISFRLLHSHLKLLSNNELKGTRIEYRFKRAFATLFGQDLKTFTAKMFLNMDQLEKQLDNKEFQEIGSMASFKVLKTQFQMFIKSQIYLYDEYVKSIDERALHNREYDTRDTSSKSGNDAHADDADIRPIYDEDPMTENAEQCHDTCPLPAKLTDTHYLPKERESVVVKPHHVIASSESRTSSKNMPRFSSNDM
ncbi:hypothetical protein Tco_1445780, partial [Tanacetum coccineum]